MGRYSHHTIVVTASNSADYNFAKKAHVIAKRMFRGICQVSPVIANKFGGASFAVFRI